jgi:hypothetical protein
MTDQPTYTNEDPTLNQPPTPESIGLGEAGGVAWMDLYAKNGAKVSVTARAHTPTAAIDALMNSLAHAAQKYGLASVYQVATQTPPVTNPLDIPPAQAPAPAAQPAGNGICPIHNAPMKYNTNQRGSWWSHKLLDGTWCNGGVARK